MDNKSESTVCGSILDETRREDGEQDQNNRDAFVVSESPAAGTPIVHSTRLYSSRSIFLLALFYICIVLFAWIGKWVWPYYPQHQLQQWLRATRVLQSLATVLTTPITSAVCASAAVVFAQRRRTARGLTLRQVMTLADRNWVDLSTYSRLLDWDDWKRHGSSLLLFAMLVNVLGLVIFPVQEILLSTGSRKMHTEPAYMGLYDITDKVPNDESEFSGIDSNLIVVMTRDALSTALEQIQAHLWSGTGSSCTYDGIIDASTYCSGGNKLGSMLDLPDSFWAELPSGYNTGLVSQYIPRINSSVHYESISEMEFPSNCDEIPGALFIEYSGIRNSSEEFGEDWSLQVCMPADLTQSPWKPTSNRQDFSEELFLNLTFYHSEVWNQSAINYRKMTVNTTAGYFELPNYMNGGVAGPLLDRYSNDIGKEQSTIHKRDRTISTNSTRPLEIVPNKGPLLTLALALFGEGSFIHTRQSHPEAYTASVLRNNSNYYSPTFDYAEACIYMTPLVSLYGSTNCIRNADGGPNVSYVAYEIKEWLSRFNYHTVDVERAFSYAAFLANQACMLSPNDRSLQVATDLGFDIQIPIISKTGMVVVSVLLGIYLTILFSLAVYAAFLPRWTERLDSFAMMRIGGVIADKVPLLVNRVSSHVDVLDKYPGWMGEQAGDNAQIGALGLGGPDVLKKGRRYMSYPGDNERPDYRDRRDSTRISGTR
ncbi:hypothetical protein PVAR5_8298 [Paecilomyces variotii No. 5]|uniref:Uncharacterized protein n=1 Tax=Byssochlamys spectabilis (strain No. 5 / NBRC 109023) TaxID=1356009 RepID=V5GF51_BYSSN|nr:hypothetical protein PVAR5_8298 [Paecilomyces variotii No. 5]